VTTEPSRRASATEASKRDGGRADHRAEVARGVGRVADHERAGAGGDPLDEVVVQPAIHDHA
jgi:hypothetical protein